jgi:hypothetical protein
VKDISELRQVSPDWSGTVSVLQFVGLCSLSLTSLRAGEMNGLPRRMRRKVGGEMDMDIVVSAAPFSFVFLVFAGRFVGSGERSRGGSWGGSSG